MMNFTRYFSLLPALVASSVLAHEPVHRHEENTIIEYSFELREWCKSESENFYVANSITPYNWTDSWWEKGNVLFVKGSWLIGHEYVIVECRIAKGAKLKHAIYEFSDR